MTTACAKAWGRTRGRERKRAKGRPLGRWERWAVAKQQQQQLRQRSKRLRRRRTVDDHLLRPTPDERCLCRLAFATLMLKRQRLDET
jgi:hypothetical protein